MIDANTVLKTDVHQELSFFDKNIKMLIDRHQLKSPVYVGDTEGDGEQSRLAGIPFVFVSYGFGETDDHDVRFDSFTDFTKHFMGL